MHFDSASIVYDSKQATIYAGVPVPDNIGVDQWVVDATNLTVTDGKSCTYVYGWTVFSDPMPSGYITPSEIAKYDPACYEIYESPVWWRRLLKLDRTYKLLDNKTLARRKRPQELALYFTDGVTIKTSN